MPEPTEFPPQDRVLTFNVIFTRGTTARLLPFALSLLQSPDVGIRVVANGCDAGEVALMRAAAEREERLSHHVLPFARPVEHGVALNDVFEAFPERRFAFIDSDVIASGDFMGAMRPAPGEAAVFTATPVWMTADEGVAARGTRLLGGDRLAGGNGAYTGNTYCAIYERDALEPAWRAAPRGFAVQHGRELPRGLETALSERGWSFRAFDTARLVNLQLLLAGFSLGGRQTHELHHVGGLSTRDFQGSRGKLRRLLAVLRSSPDGRLRRVANGIANRSHLRGQPDPGRERRMRRCRQVISHVDEAIDAILAGEAAPAPLRTDSPQVDRRVAELVAAVQAQYPPGVAFLREATGTSLRDYGLSSSDQAPEDVRARRGARFFS